MKVAPPPNQLTLFTLLTLHSLLILLSSLSVLPLLFLQNLLREAVIYVLAEFVR